MHTHWHLLMGKKLGAQWLKRHWNEGQLQWFRHSGFSLQGSEVSLQDGYLCKFGTTHEVFRCSSEDATEDAKKQTWLCMGQNTWAALMWPLVQFESDGDMYFSSNQKAGLNGNSCANLFPGWWFKASLVFHPTGSEMPLSCFYLRSASFFGILDALFSKSISVCNPCLLFSFENSFTSIYFSQAVEEGQETQLGGIACHSQRNSLERVWYHFEIDIEWRFVQCCSTSSLWRRTTTMNCKMKWNTRRNQMLKSERWCTWQWVGWIRLWRLGPAR